MRMHRPIEVTATGDVPLGSFRRINRGQTVKIYASGATADRISCLLGGTQFVDSTINLEISANVVDLEGRDLVGMARAGRDVDLTISLAGTVTGTNIVLMIG